MSRKSNLQSYQALNGQSMAAGFTSPVTTILNQDNIGIQLNFTGTPTGTFVIEVCSDYKNDRASAGSPVVDGETGTWVALPLDGNPVAAGAADQIYIDLNQLPAPFLRVRYVRSSGTGACDMFLTSKML